MFSIKINVYKNVQMVISNLMLNVNRVMKDVESVKIVLTTIAKVVIVHGYNNSNHVLNNALMVITIKIKFVLYAIMYVRLAIEIFIASHVLIPSIFLKISV
jgi:hypothetical protein